MRFLDEETICLFRVGLKGVLILQVHLRVMRKAYVSEDFLLSVELIGWAT